MKLLIRLERSGDAGVIRRIIERAFAAAPHRECREQDIVCRLRAADAMTFSLVAELDGLVRGHVAAFPATAAGRAIAGPLSRAPLIKLGSVHAASH
jgi:putative acetyltransferase